MYGTLFANGAINTKDGSFAHPEWFDCVGRLIGSMSIPPFDLEEFLLPDDDDGITEWRATCFEQRKKDKEDALSAFHEKHLHAYNEIDLAWPPDYGEFGPCSSHLCRRMREVAYYFTQKLRHQTLETVHDLNMSIDFMSEPRLGGCPCLVSTARPWLRRRQRDLIGDEALALQGWDILRQREPRDGPVSGRGRREQGRGGFSNQQKLDLAGNAFCGFVIAPVLVALITSIDWGVSMAVKEEMRNSTQFLDDTAAKASDASDSASDSPDGDADVEGGESEQACESDAEEDWGSQPT